MSLFINEVFYNSKSKNCEYCKFYGLRRISLTKDAYIVPENLTVLYTEYFKQNKYRRKYKYSTMKNFF